VTRLEAAAHAARLKRSEATVWRWAKAGCNFDDPESDENRSCKIELRGPSTAKNGRKRAQKKSKTWKLG